MNRTPSIRPALVMLSLGVALAATACGGPNPYERAQPTPKAASEQAAPTPEAPEPTVEPAKHVDVPLRFTEIMALSPDGRFLAVGGASEDEASLKVLSTVTWRVVHDFSKDKGSTTALAFSPQSDLLAWGSFHDNEVVLADLSTGKLLHQFSVTALVDAIAFSFDGQFIAAHSQDANTKVWYTRRGNESAALSNKSAGLSFHPAEPLRVMVLSEQDDILSLELLKAPSYELVHSQKIGPSGTDAPSSLMKDAETIAHCSSLEAGTVSFYRLPSFEAGSKVALPETTTCDVIAVSPHGPYLMVTSYTNASMSMLRFSDNPESLWQKPLGAFVFDPDGRHVLSSASDTGLVKIDLLTGKQSKPLAPNTCAATSMAITSDGGRVILGCNKEVQIVDLGEGRVSHSIR